jgi:pSer/pThr/pTyr-binding forkhead associated (FHA) protein
MRLVVKQGGRTTNEFRSTKGPIHIGRHTDSQILLPDGKVSRQHAVIFPTEDGKWTVRDLDSANKTYLNDKAIHEAEVKTGDHLCIADFTIEIDLRDEAGSARRLDLEDTLTTAFRQPQTIVRTLDAEHAPDIRLPAKRTKDFIQATEAICQANGPDEVLRVLLKITTAQFAAYRTWCTLRNEPAGPMTCHAGRSRDGQKIQLSNLELNKKITQSVEKGEFLLLPQVQPQKQTKKVNSAMIAPVIGASGCFGVLYVDNDTRHEQYSPSDLDYLMLLAIHTAAVLENF